MYTRKHTHTHTCDVQSPTLEIDQVKETDRDTIVKKNG